MATYFVEPYTKYYNSLNSSGGMDKKYKDLEDNSTALLNNISSLSTFISSSTWSELGCDQVKNESLPKIKQALDSLNKDITEYFKKALDDSHSLLSKVQELKLKDEEYETKKSEVSICRSTEPAYRDNEGRETSAHISWRNNLATREKELETLKEECEKLQEAAKGLAGGINGIEILETVEQFEIFEPPVEIDPNSGTVTTWTYNGVTYVVPRTKMSVADYVHFEQSHQIYETKDYSRYRDHCLGFAYVHAYDMQTGTTSDTAENGLHYSHAGSFKGYDNNDKGTILREVYNEINSGRPIILQVNGNKKGTSRHYVTVLGYNSNVRSASDLTEDDLIIMDSYDGQVKRMGTNGSRFMITGAACGKNYSGYQIYRLA